MEDGHTGLPLEPTLKLTMCPANSNLRFRTPHYLTIQQHLLLDNFWVSKNNPSHFLHVMQTLNTYFMKTNEHVFGVNSSPSYQYLVPFQLRAQTVDHFVEQERGIKTLEGELEWWIKEEHELRSKMQQIKKECVEYKIFIGKGQKEREERLGIFLEKIIKSKKICKNL